MPKWAKVHLLRVLALVVLFSTGEKLLPRSILHSNTRSGFSQQRATKCQPVATEHRKNDGVCLRGPARPSL